MTISEVADLPPMMPIARVVETFGVTRTFIYERLADGTFTARKAGRRVLIETASITSWLHSLPPATFGRKRRQQTTA